MLQTNAFEVFYIFLRSSIDAFLPFKLVFNVSIVYGNLRNIKIMLSSSSLKKLYIHEFGFCSLFATCFFLLLSSCFVKVLSCLQIGTRQLLCYSTTAYISQKMVSCHSKIKVWWQYLFLLLHSFFHAAQNSCFLTAGLSVFSSPITFWFPNGCSLAVK